MWKSELKFKKNIYLITGLREKRTCANISAALKITQADDNAKLGRDSWKCHVNIFIYFFFLLKCSGVKDDILTRVTPGNK